MICYMDKTWCNAKSCAKYNDCQKALPYAIRKQEKEEPDALERIPYAVRDMSAVCKEYEHGET